MLAAVLAVIAILVSVVVGFINHNTAESARQSARAAADQAASSERQANAAWEQVNVAYRQLEQAGTAHRQSLEPYVVVSIAPSGHTHQALVLTIENVGVSLARNIRISADPPLRRSYESGEGPATPIMTWHIFTNGIATLAPRQRIDLPFDIISERLTNDDLPDRYRFTVEAMGPFGQAPTLTYDVDLSIYKHEYIDELTTHHVAKALREINSVLKWFKQQQMGSEAKARFEGSRASTEADDQRG